jgi:rare lipoprotein A (peptidoglycan hydrolase)
VVALQVFVRRVKSSAVKAIRTGFVCGAAVLVSVAWTSSAEAKLPGLVHCYNDICHRVRTVEETAARRGVIEPVVASFYDSPANDRFNPRSETSSGAMFDADTPDNAASPIHPDGTVLLIWSPVTRGAAVVRVNNAGPYYPGRTLDVSRGTAEKLGFSKGGVMQLLSVVISAPSEPEARYQRGRVYPKVRGYLGTFENLALASLEDPSAREAIFQGNQPLPVLALSPTQQLVLTATEQHIKASALAEAFAAVPNELVEPPDLHISMVAADGETVTPEAAAHMAVGETVALEHKPRVMTTTVAALPSLVTLEGVVKRHVPAEVIRVTVQKARAIEAPGQGVAKARPLVRRGGDGSGVSQAALNGRTWFESDIPVGR